MEPFAFGLNRVEQTGTFHFVKQVLIKNITEFGPEQRKYYPSLLCR